jgi:hypothetical protein
VPRIRKISDSNFEREAVSLSVGSSGTPEEFRFRIQTGSGALPASCTMGTDVLSQDLKRVRGVTLTTHPHLVPRSRMSMSYLFSPPQAPAWRVVVQL